MGLDAESVEERRDKRVEREWEWWSGEGRRGKAKLYGGKVGRRLMRGGRIEPLTASRLWYSGGTINPLSQTILYRRLACP
jgi:hypothetical protein